MRTVQYANKTYRISEVQFLEWSATEALRLLDRVIRQRELLAEWNLLALPAWIDSLKETVRRGGAAREVM